jgi:GH24 family phage-related lysozyme (muramidase)
MIFEGFSARQIADNIQHAVGGPGTDENLFYTTLLGVTDVASIAAANKIMTDNPDRYTYPTIGNAMESEFGEFDQEWIDKINRYLRQFGLLDYINSTKAPVQAAEATGLISTILSRVIQHEGKKAEKYIDSRGIPTIGVGFNLNNSDAAERLKKVGANPAKIKAGKAKLTERQIKTLLVQDLERALSEAMSLVPNFNQLPQTVQGVLVEMAFNLGKSGLSEFKNFLSKISGKRWKEAAAEMLKSDWRSQVGQRAQTLADIIKSVGSAS